MNDVGNFWFQMNLHVLEGIVFKVEHMISMLIEYGILQMYCFL